MLGLFMITLATLEANSRQLVIYLDVTYIH